MNEFQERLNDWTLWFHENKDRIPAHDLQKRCDFYEKAIDGCLELIILNAIEMMNIQKREKSGLYIPAHIKMEGVKRVRP